jgi:prepilin-type N-terminal cleavage/methylation domain-containing protein
MRLPGFTMIEVVVAIALSTAIVAAVYSVTVSSKASAERQAAARSEDIQKHRFAAVLRRDCRGWLARGSNGATFAPDTEDRVLLSFTTSADAIAPESDASGNTLLLRCIAVRYFARRVSDGYAIVRSEAGAGSAAEVSLLSVKAMPKVEFYDGRTWSEAPRDAKLRPAALRIVVDDSVTAAIGL